MQTRPAALSFEEGRRGERHRQSQRREAGPRTGPARADRTGAGADRPASVQGDPAGRASPWTDRQKGPWAQTPGNPPQPTEGNGSYRPHFCASGTATNPSALLLRCRREATLGLALASLGPADGGQPGLRAVAVDKPPLGALCRQPPR